MCHSLDHSCDQMDFKSVVKDDQHDVITKLVFVIPPRPSVAL